MRTIVFTSDNHSWLLKGFLHQWAKYGGGREVEVAGFTPPAFLPSNVPFHSMGDFKDYPVQKWSDAIINTLRRIPDDYFLFLLEDYWLIRQVNWDAIDAALELMMLHQDIIRFDVAADRMFNRDAHYAGPYKCIDLCICKGEYSLSFQASIFNRKMLLEVLRPGESPWQAEIAGSSRLNQWAAQVMGSYQWPMNYLIAMNKGELDLKGGWMYPARSMPMNDWQELVDAGCLVPEAA